MRNVSQQTDKKIPLPSNTKCYINENKQQQQKWKKKKKTFALKPPTLPFDRPPTFTVSFDPVKLLHSQSPLSGRRALHLQRIESTSVVWNYGAKNLTPLLDCTQMCLFFALRCQPQPFNKRWKNIKKKYCPPLRPLTRLSRQRSSAPANMYLSTIAKIK